MEITVQFSFKRDGDSSDIRGSPTRRAGATDDERIIYRTAVMKHCNAALRCHLPMAWAMRLRAALSRSDLTTDEPTQTEREESMADNENTLILETTQGPVTIEMRPDLAPNHVARIKELVREGFYDGIVFHRVIDGFMAQTGCPQGTGTGGSGKKLKAEFNKEPHVRGTVSMARAQVPNSGDSQFFICFDDARS